MLKINRQDALNYHSQAPAGKIEVVPTKPMSTQLDLALAYSPGVAEPCLAIAANPDIVAKFKAGNEKSKNALTGQVMKAMKGQARPDVVNRLIDERLAAL